MLFNSLSFALFFPVVFFLYWFVFHRNLKWQNALLLVASYFFYACWDWRFLFLLMFSTALDYYTGARIANAESKKSKQRWLWLSIIINLGFLGAFKYYDFFATSFAEFISNFGLEANPVLLNIILPVGISFYTFHGLSYVLDIYRGKIPAEKNIVDYSVFVSFFPLLVAGPIERATHLLPQIRVRRIFDYARAVDGVRQILWGLFKKIVIADQCAEYVNLIFDPASDYSGSTRLLGAILFAFQIYADFSGYSDIALGTARLLGIDLLRNFAFPYFSRDIAEFWRRWHISLSSWFRDYVYFPLGGSRGTKAQTIRNVLIIFLLSGFWHGANWTFIVWGLLNAIYILPLVLMHSHRDHIDIVARGRYVSTWREAIAIIFTFMLTVFAWIFFRSETVGQALNYIASIFSPTLFSLPAFSPMVLLSIIAFFIAVEWIGRENKYAIEKFGLRWYRPVRWAFYFLLINMILLFHHSENEFIYFQF
jgi:alginate O-acetyltransferase complex protein AlgI